MLLSELIFDGHGSDLLGYRRSRHHLRDWERGLHICIYYDPDLAPGEGMYRVYIAQQGQKRTRFWPSEPELMDGLTVACLIADAVWHDTDSDPGWTDWIRNPPKEKTRGNGKAYPSRRGRRVSGQE